MARSGNGIIRVRYLPNTATTNVNSITNDSTSDDVDLSSGNGNI